MDIDGQHTYSSRAQEAGQRGHSTTRDEDPKRTSSPIHQSVHCIVVSSKTRQQVDDFLPVQLHLLPECRSMARTSPISTQAFFLAPGSLDAIPYGCHLGLLPGLLLPLLRERSDPGDEADQPFCQLGSHPIATNPTVCGSSRSCPSTCRT